MKIAVIVRILWSAGTQKFAIEEAKALSAFGHDGDLIFIRRGKNGYVYDDLLKDINHIVLYKSNKSIFIPVFDFITSIIMKIQKR